MQAAKTTDKAQIEKSEWFDAEWYTARYPDVSLSGLSPVDHYLNIGEALGRQSGPYFDAGYYLHYNPDVAKAGISPLLHFIRYGQQEGRVYFRSIARECENALWKRESVDQCVQQLTTLLKSDNKREASYAGWALARWYAWHGEWHPCAKAMEVCQFHPSLVPTSPATHLLYMEALTNTGQWIKAYQVWLALRRDYPNYLDAHLGLANLLAAQAKVITGSHEAARLNESLRLESINTLYRQVGLTELSVTSITSPLTLETIGRLPTKSMATVEGAKIHIDVSVIVPVFNAGAYLATTLQSLAAQTLSTIEVIMIDDASTDDSRSIAEQFQQQDPRFKLFCQPVNQGAYAARNLGLSKVRGRYVTVHDSDDWSHPQKLQLQADGLEANPTWKACTSDMVRCTTDMIFGRWRIAEHGGWVYRNTSSLMMRREVVDTLGYWDRVRCSADTEYLHRILAAYGQESLGLVLPGVPLALCRDQPTSLSQAGPTHLVTQFKGVRYDYMQAAGEWHARARTPNDLYLSDAPKTRPFESPALNLPG